MESIKIAFLGHGNVGGGTCQILKNNADLISQRIGRKIEVTHILISDTNKPRNWPTLGAKLVTDFDDILNSDVDIIIEALGEIEPAATYMKRALERGKHVVTAAKYPSLIEAAKSSGVSLRFEASVGGGIPALSAILGNLRGNRFTEISGILNGTTNYILTKMASENLMYEDVLKTAQELGFAEADPTADVEGIDAANKLSILMAIGFDEYISPESIPRLGITKVTDNDIAKASAEGKKIKLLGTAKIDDGGKLEYFVKPVAIDASHPLYNVDNEYNAILVRGDAVEDVMMYGKGAGPLPTGSAVLGDIIDIAERL